MDKVIKEGTLRVLISESTCDVILSCKDHRLMAHKLILSIASPVFRELLRKNSTDSTSVVIIPDISGSIMSTILDYIYTGTTALYSNSLQEFLSVASFLQIAVDTRSIESVLGSLQKVEDVKKLEMECHEQGYKDTSFLLKPTVPEESIKYSKMDVKKQDMDCDDVAKETLERNKLESLRNSPNSKLFQTKAQKRLPDLLPISSEVFKKNTRRKMCNVIVPSPWSQSNERNFLGDPREVTLKGSGKEIQKLPIEDSNNNLQPTQHSENVKCSPKSLDSIIRHLYLSNLDNDRKRNSDKNTKHNATLGEDFSRKRDILVQCSENYQKDVSRTREAADPFDFSFPRNCTDLKNVKKQIRSENIDLRLNVNNGSVISNSKSSDDKNIRTFLSEYSLEPIKRNLLPLDFTQKLNLHSTKSQPSPTHLPPSNTLDTSLFVPNNPFIWSKTLQENSEVECRTSEEPTRVISSSFSNDGSNFNDISNENSLSNDSSSDEKKINNTRTKKKSYKCKDCGKSFSQLRNYKYHRSVHEGTKEFSAKCPECGKMFNDRGYLSSHMKIHRDRKEYACPNCPKRFNQRVAYNMHLRIHTGVKPHECPTCGKSFSRKMLLKQHQRVHTGERPYTCPECGKTFADRSNMSLHARLHTGVKPYGCSLCPKSFTKKHHLKTHMNFHTGLKPYTCEKCGLAFSQSSNMRTHYKKCVLKNSIEKSTKSESVSSSAENNSS